VLFGRGMRAIIVGFDVVLLGVMASHADVGIYTAAYRVTFFVLALAVAVHTAYLPVLARAARLGPERFRVAIDEALTSGAIVGAPLVAGGILTSGAMMRFLFGASYAGGASALSWLMVSIAFVFVHGVLHDVYVVTRRTAVEARWFAAAAGLNIAANFWLIPRFGISGAALATALAELTIASGGVFVSRVAEPRAIVRAWTKPACAAAAMAGALWLSGDALALPARCAIGAVVYGGVLIALFGVRTTRERLGLQIS
jgi:O-antigen/teichoic acid export membrane protein